MKPDEILKECDSILGPYATADQKLAVIQIKLLIEIRELLEKK